MVVYSGPDGYRRLAEERHYVRPGDDFIKPVVAAEGAFVCIRDGYVTVNGKVLGEIQKVDSKGNYLPQAYLCRPLVLDELFVMSPQKNGYDGRYFGVLKGSDVKACGVHLF